MSWDAVVRALHTFKRPLVGNAVYLFVVSEPFRVRSPGNAVGGNLFRNQRRFHRGHVYGVDIEQIPFGHGMINLRACGHPVGVVRDVGAHDVACGSLKHNGV